MRDMRKLYCFKSCKDRTTDVRKTERGIYERDRERERKRKRKMVVIIEPARKIQGAAARGSPGERCMRQLSRGAP